jgi:hypothetical protein
MQTFFVEDYAVKRRAYTGVMVVEKPWTASTSAAIELCRRLTAICATK